jgi:branched-chain amino acid transport system ATP-binding protein
MEAANMLDIRQLATGYCKKPVLSEVVMHVSAGEVVAVIGPNGAGKSTVLKAVHGLLPAWQGDIRFSGQVLGATTPAARVRRGITYCPQGRRVFGDLTVRENLEIGALALSNVDLKARVSEQLDLFPSIRNRLTAAARNLSGGEQQMVALARALISKPKLLMLDEPSLGLSPQLVAEVFQKIVEINRTTGTSVLIVEQKVREVLKICNRVYSLKLGRVAYEGPPDPLRNERTKLKELFL